MSNETPETAACPWFVLNGGHVKVVGSEAVIMLRRRELVPMIRDEIVPEVAEAKVTFLADARVARFRTLCVEIDEALQWERDYAARLDAAESALAELALRESGDPLSQAQFARDGAAQELTDVRASLAVLRKAAATLQAELAKHRQQIENDATSKVMSSGMAASRAHADELAQAIAPLLDKIAIQQNRTARARVTLPQLDKLIGRIPQPSAAPVDLIGA
jgi:hypothetical protein